MPKNYDNIKLDFFNCKADFPRILDFFGNISKTVMKFLNIVSYMVKILTFYILMTRIFTMS